MGDISSPSVQMLRGQGDLVHRGFHRGDLREVERLLAFSYYGKRKVKVQGHTGGHVYVQWGKEMVTILKILEFLKTRETVIVWSSI